MKRRTTLTRLSLASMMLALGLLLPFLTGQIPEIGNMLLPMHLPVFICSFLCGPMYGAIIGFSLPIMRSAIFSMPIMFPNAVAMAFELCTYGLVSGLIYRLVKKQNLLTIYISLIAAMVLGRLVWGLADYLFLSLSETGLTWEIFISSTVLTAFPGIILQLIFIPILLEVLNKTHLVTFVDKTEKKEAEA